MNYIGLRCICCKGTWRARIEIPRGGQRYIVAMKPMDVICGRCNNRDCACPETDLRCEIGCNEGRRDAS